MRIKTTTGKTIDTSKLTDRDAEISEALHNLYEVCKLYNVTMFTRVIPHKAKFIGAQYLINAPDDKSEEDKNLLYMLIDRHISDLSNGEMRVVSTKPDQGDDENLEGF